VTLRSPGSEHRHRLIDGLGLLLVVGIAAGVRLLPWSSVFTPAGVRFTVDTDPHYHVLRVHRAIAEWPQVASRDPWLDYPNGVDVVWPPLFDAVMASAAEVLGAGHPTPELVERVAAFFPVVLGAATVAVVAVLGRIILGGGLWLDAALLLALLPVHARFSMVGRPDQHVAEVLNFCLVLLAFVVSSRTKRRLSPAVVLGLTLCVGFWTWQGSALNLATLGAVLAGWHVLAPPGEHSAEDMAIALASGATAAAGLLALSLAAFGPPGAVFRMSLSGLTGFPILLCALTATFAGGVLLFRRRWPSTSPAVRALQLFAVVSVALLPLAIPATWPPLRQGAMAFARSGKWYSTISEFSPMFGQYPLADELPYRFAQLGFTLLVAPLALVPLWQRWHERPGERATLFAFSLVLSLLYALALRRVRFGAYLAPLLAIAAALAVRSLTAWVTRRARIRKRPFVLALSAAGMLLVAPPTPAHLREGLSPEGLGMDETLISTLKRLGTLSPAVAERPAVFARWPIGHLIRYYASKPVVTNGFGIEGGPHALDDWALFAFATEEGTAERVLEQRRIGFLILGDPAEVMEHDRPFAPPGTPPVVNQSPTGELRPLPAFFDLALTRVGVFEGGERPGRTEAGLGHFRLLLESLPGSMTSALKVFGWVPGCRVQFRGGPPGLLLHVIVRLTSNLGLSREWRSSVEVDPSGRAEVLVPYATGMNGYVRTTPYELATASDRAAFVVEESCVAGGGSLALDLGSPSSP
jgi:asparagine N-glycosylation enzyme membrane subunit Stt3